MTIKEITNIIEELAPLSNAEDFDNVGLLVGNDNAEVNGVLITIDTLEEVVDEAIQENCNLILSFHPIIFDGLKKINGENYVEKAVLKAIKNDIAIYSMHTALDNSFDGVSSKMCEVLDLKKKEVLIPKKNKILKLTTYIPKENAENLLLALHQAGAGELGNYTESSFSFPGVATFKANENANPTVGKKNKLEVKPETCVNVTFEKHKKQQVLNALFKNHIYEEVAYEITTLNNQNQQVGMGMIGELPVDLKEEQFLEYVAEKFNAKGIRYSNPTDKMIRNVAVLGGSGAFAIEYAKKAKVDAYISADFKYHDFFKAENQLILIDIGHYESEQFTKNLLFEYLSKKITNFAPTLKLKIIISKTNTNPINYLK
jgi:dinuclear metal center YbgI/SA1388 family protein